MVAGKNLTMQQLAKIEGVMWTFVATKTISEEFFSPTNMVHSSFELDSYVLEGRLSRLSVAVWKPLYEHILPSAERLS